MKYKSKTLNISANKLLFKKLDKKYFIKQLHKKCWKLMSEIVRRQSIKKVGNIYVYECFTCGKRSLSWKDFEAGHYIHNCLDFHEKNIHAQCTECNHFKHGELGKYAIALQRKYGEKVFEELEIARTIERKQKKSIIYYLALEKDLKEKLALINKE